jgi:hypothetical protein
MFYAANMFILMLFHGLCLFHAQLCYIVVQRRKAESNVQITMRIRKEDYLSLIFRDSYVRALTPSLNSSETMLKLSSLRYVAYKQCHQKIDLRQTPGVSDISYIYMHTVQCGDRSEPAGATTCISLGVDISPLTETRNFR